MITYTHTGRYAFGIACGLFLAAVCTAAMLEAPAPLTPAVTRTLSAADVGSGSICLNTATAEELMTLPELGTVLAARILDYRAHHHGFDSLGELLQVEGVGEERLRLWRDYLYIGNGEDIQ
ncbi:MAG: helix-hairpin-helix domain-containing protein [Clostridia bacterium]|nr:helix-hairpin-helix domain-containing protein [Clostridia bacterium]